LTKWRKIKDKEKRAKGATDRTRVLRDKIHDSGSDQNDEPVETGRL
jgi:hypothetical protein